MGSHQRGACMVNRCVSQSMRLQDTQLSGLNPLCIKQVRTSHLFTPLMPPPPPPPQHMHILPFTTNPWYTAWSEGRMSSLTNKYLGRRVVHSNALQDSGPIVCDLNVLTSSGSRAEEYLILRAGVGQGVGHTQSRMSERHTLLSVTVYNICTTLEVYSGTSLQRTPLGLSWLSCIQWNLSMEDTIGTQLAVLYTVGPLYGGHHWNPAGCSVYSGTSLWRAPLEPSWLFCIQWNLSIEATIGTQLAVLYTVEPLHRGHHWNPAGCPVYSGTSLWRTPLEPSWLFCIQWNLSMEDTIGTQLAVLYKVEPLYGGHHWDPAGCSVYSGTSLPRTPLEPSWLSRRRHVPNLEVDSYTALCGWGCRQCPH